jgi:hypothetical protein
MPKALTNSLAKKSDTSTIKHIDKATEKAIDFIELVFDDIIDNKNITNTFKILLLRLQIPIIKASICDLEFFTHEHHPARALLNTIADTNVGAIEYNDEAYNVLDRIVSHILSEHELTTATFQTALNDLNAYILEKDLLTNTKAAEEEEQKVLLRKFARATTLKLLRIATVGNTLPDKVHALILKRWPTLMFNHYLSHGRENDEWTMIILTLRHIIDSVQPITTTERLKRIIQNKDKLFEQTRHYLSISVKSEEDIKNVLTAFKETVHQQITEAKLTDDEETITKSILKKPTPIKKPAIDNKPIDRATIPSNIMQGMWFKIHMGEDQAVRRCKLSVILVEDANLMFVNHKGELVAEKSFDEFNIEIANDTTKVIMGHSAFENTFKTIINRPN